VFTCKKEPLLGRVPPPFDLLNGFHRGTLTRCIVLTSFVVAFVKRAWYETSVKMETTFITDETVEYVQLLAKCDISKEDLTDAVEYFRGKYINEELIICFHNVTVYFKL
jgi:hypothetical protein